jgi:hypothetical protein
LKSADDKYRRILKNKLIKLKKLEDRTQWLIHGTCSYIRMYINAVADSVMLYLRHDFYNIVLKSNKNYIYPQVTPPPPPPQMKNFEWAPGFISKEFSKLRLFICDAVQNVSLKSALLYMNRSCR